MAKGNEEIGFASVASRPLALRARIDCGNVRV